MAQQLRADAERNRSRILDAAADLFAEKGLAVGLDEIARHAGVGVGTAYRRFPSKDELIEALFEQRIARAWGGPRPPGAPRARTSSSRRSSSSASRRSPTSRRRRWRSRPRGTP